MSLVASIDEAQDWGDPELLALYHEAKDFMVDTLESTAKKMDRQARREDARIEREKATPKTKADRKKRAAKRKRAKANKKARPKGPR
jgi:hypothetical protein